VPGPTVRRAQREDVERLAPLVLDYVVGFYRQPRPSDKDLQAVIEVGVEGREGASFLAERDGRLLGFATLYFSWGTLRAGRIAIMNDLYVVEAARGTGVAADLFRACAEESARQGCVEMTWETAPDNVRAQRFYDRMGGHRGEWVTYSIDTPPQNS
jgi:ribosomal protein S18 acetylase RimI-like enzyme